MLVHCQGIAGTAACGARRAHPLCTSCHLSPQTFLLWLCTFHTNLVTSWLFLSLAILFWLLAGGVTYPAPHDQESRVVS